MRLSLFQALGPSEMGQTCRDSPSETRHWNSGSCPTYFLIYQIFYLLRRWWTGWHGYESLLRPNIESTAYVSKRQPFNSREPCKKKTQHTVPDAKRTMDDVSIAIHCAYV